VQTYEGDTGISIDLEAQLGDERLAAEIETVLYRTVQEAMTNVVKHAQARHASVVLTRRGSSVAAVIEDDGRGFDPDRVRLGAGLANIRDRVDAVGGSLDLRSAPRAGTRLEIRVPARRPAAVVD